MATQYHYDGQIRRFLTQFIRMMSNFQVEFGKDNHQQSILQRVPVYYGDASRQASMILRNNSENTLNAVPAMAVYINGISYDQSRMQEPNFVSKMQIRQKSYDPVTGDYGTTQDTAYTVERMMPVPYKLSLKLDIWTSNTEQKLQLFEQIGVLFNPSMEIQSTDNYIDWTSLSVVNRTDLTWTSRSIPVGGEEPIDVMTMTFEIPIWISAPAKVKQLGVVQKIIASVFDANGQINEDSLLESNLMARRMLTPLGYGVLYVGNTLTLVKANELPNADGSGKIGTPDTWHELIEISGQLKDGTSQIRLELEQIFDETLGTTQQIEIIGTVAYHPSDPTVLLFTVDTDTLPTNTIGAVNAIINPKTITVGNSILTPASGTRYLILEDIGVGTEWNILDGDNNPVIAYANDIIEYNGTNWIISFDSTTTNTLEYMTNLTTHIQYKWQGGAWTKSVEGVYREGEWSLIL